MLICPVCRRPLKEGETGWRCAAGHSFDRARSGYVNLLPPGGKHSRMPGDNKLMVDARRAFLEKGHYAFLSDAFNALCGELLETPCPAIDVLDVGCGEGYYTGRLAADLAGRGKAAPVIGIDISKLALDKAGKRCRGQDITFAVASAFHLPVADHSCRLAANLFAPYCGEELRRVLHPKGHLVLVIPAEEHLWELKQAVYDQPYKNALKDFGLEGFCLLEHRHTARELNLEGEDLLSLFQMTPYYYKTSREGQERVKRLASLQVQAAFELLAYIPG